MRPATKGLTQHITDERLRGFITGEVELNDEEQGHMLNCEHCNDRFRAILTSSTDAQAS